MTSSIKIVYLAAALFLVLGTMPTFPSCQAGGCCPGRIKEQCYGTSGPCVNDVCAAYCQIKGHKSEGAYCVKRNNGQDCCCVL
uniref:Uncharacterized protein n=1 Tax=Zea mays TaxID=4577 RepID=B6SMG1_MAIZE|nr:hypothetical protein [Zea mays]